MFNYMGCDEQMIEEGVEKHGVAPGARKMMDNEYLHAEDSIKTGIYVPYPPNRSPIPIRIRRVSAQGWARIRSASAPIPSPPTTMPISARNSTLPVNNVHARSISSSQADLKNAGCTGCRGGRTSMSTHGDPLVSASITAKSMMLITP